jgi:hypothetical protein
MPTHGLLQPPSNVVFVGLQDLLVVVLKFYLMVDYDETYHPRRTVSRIIFKNMNKLNKCLKL